MYFLVCLYLKAFVIRLPSVFNHIHRRQTPLRPSYSISPRIRIISRQHHIDIIILKNCEMHRLYSLLCDYVCTNRNSKYATNTIQNDCITMGLVGQHICWAVVVRDESMLRSTLDSCVSVCNHIISM